MRNSDSAHRSVIMKKWVMRDPDYLVETHMLYQGQALMMAIYLSHCSGLYIA
jgi:hypothetical protein